MNHDQLAELLAGIAKAQNAVLDAMDRAMPGFKNTHLAPVLNVAANTRLGEPRLVDLPSRVLLRYQGRAAVDVAAIKADLDRLLGAGGASAAATARAPSAATAAAPVAAAAATASDPAAAPAAAPVDDVLDFSKF